MVFTNPITVEVAVGENYRPKTGTVRDGGVVRFKLFAGDLARNRLVLRSDSNVAQADAILVIGVPAAGLPFEPAAGQIVIADRTRWLVVSAQPTEIGGVATTYRLELRSQGAA